MAYTENYQQLIDSVLEHREGNKGKGPNSNPPGSSSMFGFLGDSLKDRLPTFKLGGMQLGPVQNDVAAQLKKYGEGYLKDLVLGNLFRKEGIDHIGDRYNQALEDRGYLEFTFGHYLKFKVPFFENPDITESRKATYTRHDVMNRNEPYRLFTGAEPTQVKIKFNMNMSHMIEMGFKSLPLHSKVPFSFNGPKLSRTSSSVATPDFYNIENVMEPTVGTLGNKNPLGDEVDAFPHSESLKYLESPSKTSNIFRELVQRQIDIIRSAVIASTDPMNSFGPPVTRLTFGTLYQGDEFITTDYSFSFDGKNGYENLSLIPRTFQVSLTLESYNSYPGGWLQRLRGGTQ